MIRGGCLSGRETTGASTSVGRIVEPAFQEADVRSVTLDLKTKNLLFIQLKSSKLINVGSEYSDFFSFQNICYQIIDSIKVI